MWRCGLNDSCASCLIVVAGKRQSTNGPRFHLPEQRRSSDFLMKVSAQAVQAAGDVLRWTLSNPGTIQCASNELQVWNDTADRCLSNNLLLYVLRLKIYGVLCHQQSTKEKNISNFQSSFPCFLLSPYTSKCHSPIRSSPISHASRENTIIVAS